MPRCTTSRKCPRRWASASAAASSACCTWTSCRSAWSANTAGPDHHRAHGGVRGAHARRHACWRSRTRRSLPDLSKIEEIREPIITATILVPQEYLGNVMTLCNQKRGAQVIMQYHGRQVMLTYDLPLNEVVLDFFDKLKSTSAAAMPRSTTSSRNSAPTTWSSSTSWSTARRSTPCRSSCTAPPRSTAAANWRRRCAS
jgi:hypothetical protein